MQDLPFIDEHRRTVEATPDRVYAALLDTLGGLFASPAAALYARAVGCDPPAASGPRPLAEGATVPGFRVVRATPGEELALEGRHWFSVYSLTFRLVGADGNGTTLRAQSRAAFPGPHGRLYRAVVVGTGGHAMSVRRMLDTVAARIDR